MPARSLRPKPTFALRLALAAAVTGTLFAGGSTALRHEERQLTFEAVRDAVSRLNELPAGVQELTLPVQTGENIHAWWWPATDPRAPALLYLHGSRSDLTDQVQRLALLRGFGFSVFAIDYRGFGRSDGDLPSEQTVYEDARAAWDWLAARQPDPAKRFIYGHSLGGAVAVDLAAALSADAAGGLIVESTFTTLVDIAKEWSFPWLPLGALMTQKFDSVGKMSKVAMPVLVVHGAVDREVPSRFAQALYAAATGPKRLLLVEGGGHSDSMDTGAEQYRQALTELFGLGPDRPQHIAREPKARRPARS
jgi:alpha-beta hydrolase superfamily lysophospholipase